MYPGLIVRAGHSKALCRDHDVPPSGPYTGLQCVPQHSLPSVVSIAALSSGPISHFLLQ